MLNYVFERGLQSSILSVVKPSSKVHDTLFLRNRNSNTGAEDDSGATLT